MSQSSLEELHPVLGVHKIFKTSLGDLSDGNYNQQTLFKLYEIAFCTTVARFHRYLPENLHNQTMKKDSRTSETIAQARMSRDKYEQRRQAGLQDTGSSANHRAYIALGSNMGNRVENIESACNELTKRNINVIRTSSLYETEPMYFEDQQFFINGVCEVFDRPCQSVKLMRLNVLRVG